MRGTGMMEQHLSQIDKLGDTIGQLRRIVLGAVENGQFSAVDRDAVRWIVDQASIDYRPLPATGSVLDGSRRTARGILHTGTVTGWLGRRVKAQLEDEARLAAAGLLRLPEESLALASGE